MSIADPDRKLRRRADFVAFILSASFAALCSAGTETSMSQAAAPQPSCASEQAVAAINLADAVAQSLSDEPKLAIAKETLAESRADLSASTSAFLPAGQLLVDEERFAPSKGEAPVQVVGNNIIGGPKSDSAYGSLNLTWNLFSSGKDVAGYRGAKAAVRATSAGLDSQLNDTLSGILQAYADLYEAQTTVEYQARTVAALKSIAIRAEERLTGGQGTTVAVGQARAAELDAERTFNQGCRDVYDKSQALAQSFGLQLTPGHIIKTLAQVPVADQSDLVESDLDAVVESDPAVISAKEQITAAEDKLGQARAQFGPTLSLTARRDYLGQSPDGFGEANRHIGPDSYRVGIAFVQPIFPFVTELASVDKGQAEVRKARASYLQARLDAEKRMQSAYNAAREALASYGAAKSSLSESQQILILTRSQYGAGRADLDSVQHAQMDIDKAQTDVDTLASKNRLASWELQRSLRPQEFAYALFKVLHIPMAAEKWRSGLPGHPAGGGD
jgi:outer membrane protein TolC